MLEESKSHAFAAQTRDHADRHLRNRRVNESVSRIVVGQMPAPSSANRFTPLIFGDYADVTVAWPAFDIVREIRPRQDLGPGDVERAPGSS